MFIKHMPNGLYPGETSGFERKPCYPEVGQEVFIGARLDEAGDAAKVWVEVSVDGERSVMREAAAVGRESPGRAYYACSIGTFTEAASVTYRIFAKSGGDTVGTKLFRFSVLKEANVRFHDHYYSYGSVFILPLIGLGGNPALVLDLDGHRSIRLYSDYSIPAQAVARHDEFRGNWGSFGMRLAVNPFSLEFFRNGEGIGRFNQDDCPVRVFCDNAGRVGKVAYHMVIGAKCFYGFGEKFDNVNQKGHEPLTYAVEKFSRQEWRTYLPIPLFYTETGFGFYRRNSYRQTTSLRARPGSDDTDVVLTSLCENGDLLTEDFLLFGSPKEILGAYYGLEGMPAMPPKWAFTPWISSNGWNTQKEALEQLDKLAEHAIPAGVMVLEAWSDEETFYIFGDSRYEPNDGSAPFSYGDFSFSADGKWPSPKEFCQALERNNMRLVLWQIPGIKYPFHEHGKQTENDEAYAIKHKFCIFNDDGTPYRVTEKWFHNSLVPDFTNPEARKWWLEKRRYLLEELHVAGFKTDGGEFLFDDTAMFHNGKTAKEMHNLYPQLYIGAYNEFMDEVLGKGNGVTFSRSGFSGAHKYPVHWAGDQISLFSEYRAQLTAGISAGLSGIVFWGFDIGGFADRFPSKELYLRSAAFAAFCPVMQFHSEPRCGQYYMTERNHWNNDRSPWNLADVHGDPEIISEYRRYANLRMSLMPYIYNEAAFCVQNGRPMMAHPIFDYPGNPAVLETDDEYLFGRSLLVAPVYEEGARGRYVYLPEGEWHDFWSGEKHVGGRSVYCVCGLDRIPVFVKSGDCIPLNINGGYVFGTNGIESGMPNGAGRYETLCILTYADSCRLEFRDDMGCFLSFCREGATEKLRSAGEKPYERLLIVRAEKDPPPYAGSGESVCVRFDGRDLTGYSA